MESKKQRLFGKKNWRYAAISFSKKTAELNKYKIQKKPHLLNFRCGFIM
jgi:hypothetical protein